MILYIVLGVVVLLAFIVLGVLFYTLNKEGQSKKEEKFVPATNSDQLNNKSSSGPLEPINVGLKEDDPEIIPANDISHHGIR